MPSRAEPSQISCSLDSPVLSSQVQLWLSAGWSESDYSELLRGWDHFSLCSSLHLQTSQHHTHLTSTTEIEKLKASIQFEIQWKMFNLRLDFLCWSLQGDLVTQLFWTLLIRQNSKQSFNIFNWIVLASWILSEMVEMSFFFLFKLFK